MSTLVKLPSGRRLSPDLFSFVLRRTTLSLEAIKALSPTAALILFDKAMNGIQEEGGQNRGRLVEQIIASTPGGAAGQPWCMFKNQAALACVEYTHALISPIPVSGWTAFVMSDARGKAHEATFITVRPGDWPIWGVEGTTSGHTGCIWDMIPGVVMSVGEGNTDLGDSVNREGDGCYMRLRPFHDIGKFKLLGFVRPFPDSMFPA